MPHRAVADLARGGDSDEARSGQGVDSEVLPVRTLTLAVNLFETSPARALYAANRLRPFARLRLSTFWPSVVRILTRKPWVLFRLRLLGWNVRFIYD